jgi:hypothetical protein
MRFFSVPLAFLLAVSPAAAAGSAGTVLDYRVTVHLRGNPQPLETRLKVVTRPPVATRNRVKRPRMVGWNLIAVPGKDGLPPASVLARVQSLLYLEAPAAGLVPRSGGMHFGTRFCRLWQAQTPPDAGAFIYLVEISPNLLALSYASASLSEGEIASLEMSLTGFTLADRPAPAESGAALLRTLRVWSALEARDNPEQEAEVVQ